MPILPAKEVKIVLPIFVRRLAKDKPKDVQNDIDIRFRFFASFSSILPSGTSYGFVSLMIWPSFKLTIRVEYASASSGLCVTMMTSFSSAICFKRFMI